MTHALGYFAPGPDTRRRGPSPWLVAGALAAIAGSCLWSTLALPIEGRADDARIAAASTDVVNLSQAISAFARDTGRYPSEAEGLAVLVWSNGPYIQQLKSDPWGRPYIYHVGGPHGGAGYRVISKGPDGLEGTSDDLVSATDVPPAPSITPATLPAAGE